MTSEEKIEKHIDNALTKFFYNKIIEALEVSEQKLVEEENYEGAAIVRDEISKLKKQLNDRIIPT